MKKLTKREQFEAEVSKAIYKQFLPLALDPIELAQLQFKKRGGQVEVLKYRMSRKAERVIRVGVKN